MNDRKAEVLVALSVVLATLGQVVLKLGAGQNTGLWSVSLPLPHLHLTLGIVCGLLVYGCGTVLWIAAVSRKAISYLYPLGSLSYILVVLCGHFLLGEPLRLGRCLGVLTMACGIALLLRQLPAPQREPVR